MGAVNGIYLPIHKHDQLMKLLTIKKIIRSHRCHQNVVFMLVIEVIFLLEFYYL